MFDPLAVLLLIASQYTFEWRRNGTDLRPMAESTPTIYGPDDGEKDDQPIQEEHVEPDERDGETADEDDIHKRETVEENQEQVSDGGDDQLKFMLEKADPEVLQEVAKELDIEKPVDNLPYDPYTDNRPDEALSDEELAQRQSRKLYAPDGKLAANPVVGKKVKSVKIKSIAEKAAENEVKSKEEE